MSNTQTPELNLAEIESEVNEYNLVSAEQFVELFLNQIY